MPTSINAKWKACTELCGTVLRPGAGKAKSDRLVVLARTYTVEAAAKRLGLSGKAVSEAVRNNAIPSFIDPEDRIRIPAAAVEAAVQDEDKWELVAGYTHLKARQISLVAGIAYLSVRSRLKKAGLSLTDSIWKDIRGQWGLPGSLKIFNSIYEERFPIWLSGVLEKKNESIQRSEQPGRTFQGKAVPERERLRQKLLEVFPT